MLINTYSVYIEQVYIYKYIHIELDTVYVWYVYISLFLFHNSYLITHQTQQKRLPSPPPWKARPLKVQLTTPHESWDIVVQGT